ncbi:hypothetical protein HZF05_09590 [Sphingomonas sp. CGMCC 1.13654]|uniref:Uncharacterized protein n=1 Tax=Sphingomonas chungangi TaxID=2683589 RepID=A0A838L5Z3_9SPHN|nr:hypothetical protein [Sphingomonas chungangi]MBA2934350.1 hypothetical protein [Sphingomonas chungangi]MVW57389.1 hypothetical protein [Sphingomonas chungangi]
MWKTMLALSALGGFGPEALAQGAPPVAMDHQKVAVQTTTHNDGKQHKQVTHYTHRTIVKTPHGTLVHTKTTTTTTNPQ